MSSPKVGDKYHLNKIKDMVYEVTHVGSSSVVLKGPNRVRLESIVSLTTLKNMYTKK